MTNDMLKAFIDDFPYMVRGDLCDKYKITPKEYDTLAARHNLRKNGRIPRYAWWSYSDIEFIKNNYQVMSDVEIAEKLHRTVSAVHVKRVSLKLFRDKKLPKSRKKVDKFTLEQKYNMCIWWLTGTSITDIRLLYSCSDEDIYEALKNTKVMKSAIFNVKEYGCFPITRSEIEIKKYCSEVKL